MINNKIKILNEKEIFKLKNKIKKNVKEDNNFLLSYNNKSVTNKYENYIKAAVLCLIEANVKNNSYNIILTKRSKNLKNHSGQISFPGGKLDKQDKKDYKECAFREAREEIGFDKSNSVYLGMLNKYITGTGYSIQPIIALSKKNQLFHANPDEVTKILHFPINFLLSNDRIEKVFYDYGNNKFYYNIYWKRNTIWGATAKILIDLVNLLRELND